MKTTELVVGLLLILLVFVMLSCNTENRANNGNSTSAKVVPIPPPAQNHDVTELTIVTENVRANQDWKVTSVNITQIEGGELIVDGLFQGRDMNQYLQGGYFDCSSSIRGNCKRQRIRDFVWKCWTKQLRGYVRFGWSGIDLYGTTHVFIEPDEHQIWTVVLKEVKVHASMEPAHSFSETVDRIHPTRTNIKGKSGQFSLELKNEEGEVLRAL